MRRQARRMTTEVGFAGRQGADVEPVVTGVRGVEADVFKDRGPRGTNLSVPAPRGTKISHPPVVVSGRQLLMREPRVERFKRGGKTGHCQGEERLQRIDPAIDCDAAAKNQISAGRVVVGMVGVGGLHQDGVEWFIRPCAHRRPG